MKKRIAKILRRIGAKLDPPEKLEMPLPLELISTPDLAEEIKRRNDCCIVFWSRNKLDSDKIEFVGELYWRMHSSMVPHILDEIHQKISQRFE